MGDLRIRSLIIDDDPFVRDMLKDKLDLFVPEVLVIDTAASGSEGIEKIRLYDPDLIFLDVEMTDMTGFEMLAQLKAIAFQTVFITSFSHYAIKAIRFNALDYLLKPIDLDNLREAVNRFKLQLNEFDTGRDIRCALQNFKTSKISNQILTIKTQQEELRLVLKDIVRIKGERNYSYIYSSDGKKNLVSKSIGELEDLVIDKGFIRCHKSHIINHEHIESHPLKLTVIMTDQEEVPIARRKKDEFQLWYSKWDNN